MQRRIITSLYTALAVSLLPAFVFAATGTEPSLFSRLLGLPFDDGRLIAIRIFQILWLIGFFSGVGFALYGLLKIREDQSDLLRGDRHQKQVQWGGIAAAVCLVVFILLSGVYWLVERSISPSVTSGSENDDLSPASLKLLSEFSDFKKITSTYPENDQRNIARNIKILVQFSEPILPSSLAEANGALITESVSIASEKSPNAVGARVQFLHDNTQLVIAPVDSLGEPNASAWYTVNLSKKIARKNGTPLFSNEKGYSWRFEVNGFVDNSPPFIESVLPPLTRPLPPNSLILINFSKSIDPTSLSEGTISLVDEATKKAISHTAVFANSFKSLIVSPSEPCGENSCGEPMYCFPKSVTVGLALRSAKLPSTRDADVPNKALFPFTGIVDAAGNALDGGGENGSGHNGKSEGPPLDNFSVHGAIGEMLDRSEPAIASINPGRDKTKIGLEVPVEVQFTKLIDPTTLHSGSIRINPPARLQFAIAHDASKLRSKVSLTHDAFTPKTLYSPDISSDVRDLSQNCMSMCIGPK